MKTTRRKLSNAKNSTKTRVLHLAKANARAVKSAASEGRDDYESPRKKPWSIFERKTNRKSKTPVRRGNLNKTAKDQVKQVRFDFVERDASSSDSDDFISYYDYDDSTFDPEVETEAGCEGCALEMLYQPGNLPAIYKGDRSDTVESITASQRAAYPESMVHDADILDEFLDTWDAKDSECERAKVGVSNSLALLWKSYKYIVGVCASMNFDWCFPDNVNFEPKRAPTKVPETHHLEGRDEIEYAYDDLRVPAIPSLESLMGAVDDALFPVDTQTKGEQEETGKRRSTTSNEGVTTTNVQNMIGSKYKTDSSTNRDQSAKSNPFRIMEQVKDKVSAEKIIDKLSLAKGNAGKVSKDDEPGASKMRNIFKNATANHLLLGGAPKIGNYSIEPSERVPKTVFSSDVGHSVNSRWRDAVADTVETMPRSNTQKEQDMYQSGYNQRQQKIAPSYQSSGHFTPVSSVSHSPQGVGPQYNYDQGQLSPYGDNPMSNPTHDHYSRNMNSAVDLWQGPVVTPHMDMFTRKQQNQHPPVPVTSRLPSVVPTINSNLSEISGNEKRDRYAGTEQQQTMAEQYDPMSGVPGHQQLGYPRTMMENINAYHMMHQVQQHHPQPHLHVQYDQFGGIIGQQQYQQMQIQQQQYHQMQLHSPTPMESINAYHMMHQGQQQHPQSRLHS
ncbi:hypothetical protein ACHAWU_008814 [Discostella pseudostelligera]|uniref:Uncharacterized protein n=1 Tax=Discostella pseudostelligera TaxID=259834 RepID=A0ABD3MZW6_9STRA